MRWTGILSSKFCQFKTLETLHHGVFTYGAISRLLLQPQSQSRFWRIETDASFQISFPKRTMATRRSARLSAVGDAKLPLEAMLPPPVPASGSRKRKTAPDPGVGLEILGNDLSKADTPSTPNKRRTKSKSAAPPPATPTPSNAKLMGEPATSGSSFQTPKPKPAAVKRLADPKASNAILLSPETSLVVTSESLSDVSPSKAPAAQTTTENILQLACDHLIKVDERMKPLIDKHYCRVFSPEGLAEKIDPFESLCSGIISQQVSGAAARAIKKRFVDLFGPNNEGRFPHPSEVAKMKIETLRTAGLSQRKAEYVQGLAEKFASGELSARLLHDASYEEVLQKLIAVRGLGLWSVEMFACFGLKRTDVFSLGDLGVQRGMAAFVGRDVNKLRSKGGKWKYMSEKEMQEMAEPFKPYRSLFMWYMWRVEETDVSTLE
jgi:DNA-3-methyladenine glycosylase II